MANSEASKIKAGMVVVVNNPDAEDRLNLRTEPRQDAPTLGKYYNGTYPEVLSDEMDGWVKVRIFDLEGYMMAKFLTYPDQLQTGAATVPTVKIQNSGGSGLNLRKSQSTGSISLGLYKNGATVRVFGVSETWCHVQTEDGNVGFMLRSGCHPYSNSRIAVAAQMAIRAPLSLAAQCDQPIAVLSSTIPILLIAST